MSVDTRTKGRRLDGYQPHQITLHDGGSVEVLVDSDLARLPVEVTLTRGGLFGRGLAIHVDGLDGAPCPINLP